ncbi:MAG: hypothetical protein LBK82_10200 [Planctomycetaceae bacterium]|nr:hypothetical protein [Planctomycetaceae bacterium]
MTPIWKAIPFAVVNQVHSRLMPTRPFSELNPRAALRLHGVIHVKVLRTKNHE